MVFAALSFDQEIAKAIVSALATALFVTIGGGVVAALATWWWQKRRETYELRTGLVERAARTAQEMYTVCQRTRRVLSDSRWKRTRDRALAQLDATYLRFLVDSASLEIVLGARYGVVWKLSEGTAKTPFPVFLRWHQIRDLLGLYYFNLRVNIPDDVLERYTKGERNRFHSGLNLQELLPTQTPTKLSKLCEEILSSYNEALYDLAKAMMKGKIVVS